MTTIRRYRHLGGHLALFALALQLALSFAHTHPQDFAGVANHKAVVATAPSPPGGDNDGDGDGHDHCGICATAQILATSVLPPPPAIAAPPIVEREWHAPTIVRIRAIAPRRSFQPRAPPQA